MDNTIYLNEFAKYSSLNVLGMIGLSCYILADTFFISRGLGANGLAALNLAIPVYSLIHGSGLMLGMGGATRYSIDKGQGETEKANITFTNTIYLAVVLAIVFLLAGMALSQPITTFLGADQEVFAMTNTYIQVILLFSPAFLMNDILICFVRNEGNPKLSMLAMITGSLSNVLLDYIFIFPLRMGIFGAVLATGLAPVISLGILSQNWWKGKSGLHPVKTKPHFSLAKSILLLGFPSLITEVSSGIVIIVFNSILLTLQGNVAVAAYGVIANLSLVVVSIYTGIAQGIQPLLSKAHGCGNRLQIHLMIRYAMITVAILSCTIYLIMFVFANPITSLFNSERNPQLQQLATTGLKLYFTGSLFAGFNIILTVFFTSIEKTASAHLISLLRGLFLIIPMAFLLSALWKITGVWLAFPATEFLVALLAMRLLRNSFVHS